MEHRYILEPYKGMNTRHVCPACRQKGKFVFYIDVETNEPLHESVGICERSDKCAYHKTPKQYFESNGIAQIKTTYKVPIPVIVKPASFIDERIFTASLKCYHQNNFYQYLVSLFGIDVANGLSIKYHLGTSKKFTGGCVFWQIGLDGLVHTGKIMGYSAATGKRIKQPFDQITWTHKALNISEFNLNQCLFGLHLLIDKNKTIAVVESEKTAILASVYLPQFIWLATSGKTQFSKTKCESLKGRKVVLYPDLGAFESWQKIAKQYNFACSDLLERKATDIDKVNGLDLADFLIRSTDTDIKTKPSITETNNLKIDKVGNIKFSIKTELKDNWQIDLLEKQLTTSVFPSAINLSPGETINDASFFINSHLSFIKVNDGKRIALPYLNRLKSLLLTLN